MSRSGLAFIVAIDLALWAIIYWVWHANALPFIVLVSAGGVFAGSLLRLQTVMDAPFYDRPAAHQYANMACWAGFIAAFAAFWL